jgi:hypothetical protein
MQKLIEVEDAKALLTEATDWSVWRWLMEKKRVRAAADRANEVLDEIDRRVKATWSDELKKAYRELELLARVDGNARIRRQYEKARAEAEGIDPGIKLTAKRLKEADDTAYQARMDAEDIFDEAERRLSTSMAREGSRRAMASWDLHEKAIRKAEAAARRSCAAT